VTLGVPDAIYAVVARRQPELMVKALPSTKEGSLSRRSLKTILHFLPTQDVLALGPGLSQHPETQKVIRDVIEKSACPLVIDADGLNALKNHTGILKKGRGRFILTPHPGEFARMFSPDCHSREIGNPKILGPRLKHARALCASTFREELDVLLRKCSGMTERLSKDSRFRKEMAQKVSKKYGIILILKGHRTVVAEPSGKIYVNSTGNPGMATGGTGDILTGILAALLGQHFSLWDTARFGVYLHGLAGDLAARKKGEVSLIAVDLLDFLPAAIRKTRPSLRGGRRPTKQSGFLGNQ
jgi:NAD(P)H-hydrate epimerase